MPASVSEADIAAATSFLKEHRLLHLRCRRRAASLIVESGPKADVLAHLRLNKHSATVWTADEFHHSGRWTPLPIRAPLLDALAAVAADFSWLLEA